MNQGRAVVGVVERRDRMVLAALAAVLTVVERWLDDAWMRRGDDRLAQASGIVRKAREVINDVRGVS